MNNPNKITNMIEQIFEVKLIVRTNGKTERTPEEIQAALGHALKWFDQADVRKIVAEQVYIQHRP